MRAGGGGGTTLLELERTELMNISTLAGRTRCIERFFLRKINTVTIVTSSVVLSNFTPL